MSGPASSSRHPERGIALVAAVLVVLLSSVVVASFMANTVSERAVASNVQVAKASLYAADAGVRTQQQVMANLAQAKIDSCVASWNAAGGVGPVITQPASIFPAGVFSISSTNPPFSAIGSIAWRDSDLTDTAQVYNYLFTIQSTGTVRNTGRRMVQAQGLMRLSAERGSFADYLLFTNTHTMANGAAIWFTSSSQFDGRVHTNGIFRFAYNPGFQDLVTSADAQAWFYNKGNPTKKNASNNGSIDVPSFYGGFNRGQAPVPLPSNAFNQQAAALGLAPTGAAVSNTTINTQLGLTGSSPPPNGIYLPHSGGTLTGGLYVQGTLDQCTMWADTTTGLQYYRLVQGGTTKTIAVNRAANTTSVQVGSGSPTVYSGTPRGVLYTQGAVSDLRGPDRVDGAPPPALGTGTQLLVCATGDVVIQRDITVEDYHAASNVLGIYSSAGSVRVGSGAPNDCYLDAFVMATGGSGEFKVDGHDSGSPRGTFHLRGGMVAQYYGGFFTFNTNGTLRTGYARDFAYDRRGLIPPYFPSTTRFNADIPSARTLAWKEI
jgi:Tfp pilus assembly protein PilX